MAKRAEKQMNREKLVGAGKQYAPTLYTVLVNASDNRKLFGFYPTMAAEIETYLMGKGTQNGLKFDGRPLVRFIVDEKLKSGRFDVIAENVAAPIIAQLRDEEMEFYGLKEEQPPSQGSPRAAHASRASRAAHASRAPLDDQGFDADSLDDSFFADFDSAKGGGAEEDAFGSGSLRGAGVPGSGIPRGVAADIAAGGGIAGASAVLPPDVRKSLARLPSPTQSKRGASSSATPIGRARLTNINAGKSYALTDAALVLGRDGSCDITIDDANISRRHAQLSQDVAGTWKLTDLDSTNGTRLNDKPVATALLRDGDQIAIGVTVLEFREDR
jgi:hypothetical protein